MCGYLNDGPKQWGWQAFFLPTVETQGKTVSVEDKLLTIPRGSRGGEKRILEQSVSNHESPKTSTNQLQLFQVIDKEELVSQNHVLYQINEAVDFSAIYDWVASLYTDNTGRPAVDPKQLLRLMLLSYLFNHSERGCIKSFRGTPSTYVLRARLQVDSASESSYHPTLSDRTTMVKTWKRLDTFLQKRRPASSDRTDSQTNTSLCGSRVGSLLRRLWASILALGYTPKVCSNASDPFCIKG
ncbi:transposase [Geobacillus genomosp. 3]|uniref:transposase n=1 Tax=Geobacillus genomosp. 3 TaxID=1921421 RepID=UPI003B5890C5